MTSSLKSAESSTLREKAHAAGTESEQIRHTTNAQDSKRKRLKRKKREREREREQQSSQT